jgi:hypothetical protein
VLGVLLAFACLPESHLCLEVIFVPASGCEVAIAIVVAVLAKCAVVLDQPCCACRPPSSCRGRAGWASGALVLRALRRRSFVVCIGAEGALLYMAGDLVKAPLRVAMGRSSVSASCILRKQLRFPEIALTHPPDTFCAVAYGRA